MPVIQHHAAWLGETEDLTRIFHTSLKNAHRVPTFFGVSREGIRPGKLLPVQLAAGEHFTSL